MRLQLFQFTTVSRMFPERTFKEGRPLRDLYLQHIDYTTIRGMRWRYWDFHAFKTPILTYSMT